MFSRFFINRPIFAAMVSIVIVMAGLLALQSLPVEQYPKIAPPSVQVRTMYPGANASVIASTVAQPIEKQINGVERMLYMSSTSTNNGAYVLDVTFEIGTDMDMAQVQVQNRIAQAKAMLPLEVQRMGITVQKSSTSILLFASLTSTNESHDNLFLSNYISLRIKDQLSRIEGVGGTMAFGAGDYSMRIWMDPDLMKARGITTTDVIAAIREQNVQVAAGQIGQPPHDTGQSYQYTLHVEGRLQEIEEFEEIVLKNHHGGFAARLKDVARVELGAQNYNLASQVNGKDAAAIGIFLKPGSNALETAERVKNRMAELAQDFPPGLAYDIPFDTTAFVRESIDEVVKTLYIAVVLVMLVILVFLQDWRASIIPIITIPVSLIGTFAVMSSLGVSINMFSLFGLVLAIGIVVDDAIVVVENAMRNINETGQSPREATIQAMKEVTGPIVATTVVLLAVFIPTAFVSGITGQLYRQFALTIATATVFSSISALTLSPALAALILRPSTKQPNLFARSFNKLFDRLQSMYGKVVSGFIRRAALMLFLFAAITGLTFWGFGQLPKGFVPNEDQGWAMVVIQLPDAASFERTKSVVNTLNQRLAAMPGVKNYVSASGLSVMDNATASNAAVIWTVFDSWEKRELAGLNLDAMVGQLWGAVADIQEAMIFAFPPPPIYGLGQVGGFELMIQDRTDHGMDSLQQETMGMMMAANGHDKLQRVFSTFRANVPQLHAEVDREKSKHLGVPLTNVYETLQSNLGSLYVNDFSKFGRTYQVRIQADAKFRADVEDISRLEVRNSNNNMVPLGSLVSITESFGPQVINRYNMYPAAKLNGSGSPGVSSGQAMKIIEELAKEKLPPGFGFEWTGMSFQEKAAQGQTFIILAFAVLFVYLVLSAQYESWSLPLSVILSVPLAVLGTVTAVAIRGLDINVYTQVGLVLLIALSCKTAILITEFAKNSREEGQSVYDAALNAARLRFRPILMTAITFIMGVFPLVVAGGAGASSRQALGTAVFSGMISATLLLIFFVPAFFGVSQLISESIQAKLKGRKQLHASIEEPSL
jgi:HAE1 family hydrophobic/amphiphilic exporter-1